jgi:GDP/UDP-N,N'-diacetylbacillosamine 2-epimerase (hydrolysing)
MKYVVVFTSGRWDLGHLWWVLKSIEASAKLNLKIIAPKNHHDITKLETEFSCGHYISAIHSIRDYGNVCDEVMQKLEQIKPDVFMVLGDTWHAHAAATSALLLNIPILHAHGGETTTGSFDNELRNSITQLATLHFTATADYANNICRMRNQKYYDYLDPYCASFPLVKPCNIFNVGSPGLDHITEGLLSKEELRVGIDLNQPFIVACFNPVTKELPDTERQIKDFCAALDKTNEQILFVMPNIDPCNNIIRSVAKSYDEAGRYSDCKPHLWHCVDNLDRRTYLSLLQFAEMMVGNSSSGIIEAASFNLPSVTVGSRQAGRIKPDNVISCPCETEAILTAIDRAREWNALVGKCENVYGDGKSSERIVEILERWEK